MRIWRETLCFIADYLTTLKLWGKRLGDLTPYLDKIDKVMRKQGFKRTSYNELSYGAEQLELILGYQAMGYEN